MKNLLRRIFLPVLNVLESGEGAYSYRESHRKILIFVGGLFLVLSIVSGTAAIYAAQIGGVLPCLLFFLIGLVCIVVGLVGSDRAVAKIWGSK